MCTKFKGEVSDCRHVYFDTESCWLYTCRSCDDVMEFSESFFPHKTLCLSDSLAGMASSGQTVNCLKSVPLAENLPHSAIIYFYLIRDLVKSFATLTANFYQKP